MLSRIIASCSCHGPWHPSIQSAAAVTAVRWLASTAADPAALADSFMVQPGSLLHICCTHPQTQVHISNKPGTEDAVTLQVAQPNNCNHSYDGTLQQHFIRQQLPGGRIIDVVEQRADVSSTAAVLGPQQLAGGSRTLAVTIPTRFCGLSVTTAGGSVTVGQLQEADMQLTTSGGDVTVARCRAHNASINTAAAHGHAQQQEQPPQQQQQQQQQEESSAVVQLHGGAIQVKELSASRVSVYSGGAPVSIQRLFGLTVDVLSAGGDLTVGSVYADRAALSSAGPAAAAAPAAARSAATAASRRGAAGSSRSSGRAEAGRRQQRVRDSSSSSSSGSGVSVVGVGSLHVGHIACMKGEARLESGGGAVTVDGLEGNAVLLSSGGDIKVHLHERAGVMYVDSDGGDVAAWLNPSGPPLGLQVKAAGGVLLDPALKVTGEVGPTMLFGVTSGDGTTSSISSQTSAMVQQAVAAARDSAGIVDSQLAFSDAGGSSTAACSAAASRWKQNAQQVAAWSQAAAGVTAAAPGSCVAEALPSSGGGPGCGCSQASKPAATRQLIINAGWGHVELKAMGWMDGIKARMQAKQAAAQQQ